MKSVLCSAEMPQRSGHRCEITVPHTAHRAWPDVNLGGSYTWSDGDAEATFEPEATYE